MVSSLPVCVIETKPPASLPPTGLGPHSSPQLVSDQTECSTPADQRPLSELSPSARAVGAAQRMSINEASLNRIVASLERFWLEWNAINKIGLMNRAPCIQATGGNDSRILR